MPREHEPTAILFLFAHQDDEFGIASRISLEVANGNRIFCAYLTDGGGGRASSETRNQESLHALQQLGVSADSVKFIGQEKIISDGDLVRRLPDAYTALKNWCQTLQLTQIICTAWEGGHPDHDASHLVALALARNLGIENTTLEFSLYNSHQIRPPFFRFMAPIQRSSKIECRDLSLKEGLKHLGLLRAYPSQWKTWLVLFPESFAKLVILRRETLQKPAPSNTRNRPHPGKLFYEHRFQISYEEFMEASKDFRASHLS